MKPNNDNIKQLIHLWFTIWESGNYLELPISNDFCHTSPFGTIEGKENYIDLIKANEDKFLGYKFQLLDEIYYEFKACVRYSCTQNDFELEVSEWYEIKDSLISKIIAYYHIGDIREDRELNQI